MAVSYKRLWKLLVDKEMSKSDLRKKAEIAPNTMTKLRRDEEVSLTILSKICKTLHADFGDIVEYVPDAEISRSFVCIEQIAQGSYGRFACA